MGIGGIDFDRVCKVMTKVTNKDQFILNANILNLKLKSLVIDADKLSDKELSYYIDNIDLIVSNIKEKL